MSDCSAKLARTVRLVRRTTPVSFVNARLLSVTRSVCDDHDRDAWFLLPYQLLFLRTTKLSHSLMPWLCALPMPGTVTLP